MKNTRKFIFILVTLFLLSTTAFFIAQSSRRAHRKLIKACHFLENKEWEQAESLFTPLEKSLWVKKSAHLGRVITGVLSGRQRQVDLNDLPSEEEVDILDFHLYTLMKDQLEDAEFEKCLQLAKIAHYYNDTRINLYYAAALLETNDVEKGFQYYSKLPDRFKYTPLGNRLKETFDLLHQGADAIVRDRKGRIVGIVDTMEGSRFFVFCRSAYQELVQPVIIHELLNNFHEKGLRLSLDMELSQIARECLDDNQGSIVLVEPKSGEILVAVSDRRTEKKMGLDSSPAFEQMLEPASISKLITTVAAFRNQIDPEEEIAGKHCNGSRRFNGKILWCPSAMKTLEGFDQALAVSCNSSFADLGVRVGWENMLKELRLFGFDSRMYNPFSLGKIIIDHGDDRSLADLSIGLENTVISPVHGALIANVFANGGWWKFPRLFHAADGLTGTTPRKIHDEKAAAQDRKLLDRSWVSRIRRAMWAVTRYRGTARYIAPPGFPVHMKTGTGGTFRDGYHINYIGYAPANNEKEKMAFCVRITGKSTSSRCRRAGYRVNHELLVRLKEEIQQHQPQKN